MDGVTATAIMLEILNLVGIKQVETMLPDRFKDGYGMSDKVVKLAEEKEVGLVITVDCGSNNLEVVEALEKKRIDVIVTDHHELNGSVPKAKAVVNPKRVDLKKQIKIDTLRNLSGAGVAFMLARALVNEGAIKAGQEKWLLDLAMIGTICDSMTLTGDNRIICKYGMIVLEKTRRPGLKELMRVAGVKKINAEVIGFQIGPRLNAAGRMETAELALKLLTTKSRVIAARGAAELDRLNGERRKQQNQIVSEVEDSAEIQNEVIVVKGEWHEGIVGIIAGRLTERYKRPSFVLTEVTSETPNNEQEKILKGSGRSFGDFNLALALRECQDILISGGGHTAACGVKLKYDKFNEFKKTIIQYYKSLDLKNQERFLDVREDVRLTEVGDLDLELIEEIEQLEPFGEGNPEPIMLLTDMFVLDASRIGTEEQHLRMLVRDENGKTLKLVAFFAPKMWLELRSGSRVNIWINLVENEWNGIRSVEGRILKLEYA